MYCIVETVENGAVLCTAVPKSWVNGTVLLWPNSYAEMKKKRRTCEKPAKSWSVQECKVIKNNIRE